MCIILFLCTEWHQVRSHQNFYNITSKVTKDITTSVSVQFHVLDVITFKRQTRLCFIRSKPLSLSDQVEHNFLTEDQFY